MEFLKYFECEKQGDRSYKCKIQVKTLEEEVEHEEECGDIVVVSKDSYYNLRRHVMRKHDEVVRKHQEDARKSFVLEGDTMGKHKSKFTDAEIEVLVKEVTEHKDALTSKDLKESYRIWLYITKQLRKTSGIQRSIADVKQRWLALKGFRSMKTVFKEDQTGQRKSQRKKTVKNYKSLLSPEEDEDEDETDYSDDTAALLSCVVKSDESSQATSNSSEENMSLQFADDQGQFPLEYPNSQQPSRAAPGPPPPSIPPPHPHPLVNIKSEAPEHNELGGGGGGECSVSSSRLPLLSPFEEQLLALHREQTAAIREGFRSLAHQNQLLYSEVCRTGRSVAKIAATLGEKTANSAVVAEELLRVQESISKSISSTNSLHSRVIHLLGSNSQRVTAAAAAATPSKEEAKSPVHSEEDGSLGQLIHEKKFGPVVTFWP